MILGQLHYCWFGPKPMPAIELHCLESWRSFLSGYEWTLWNEQSLDLGSCAFASDYARVNTLQRYRGLYMDTAMAVLLDTFAKKLP